MNPLDHLFRDKAEHPVPEHTGGLKVIGVGLSVRPLSRICRFLITNKRTGTGSLYTAFELLGFSPCQHGHTLLADTRRSKEAVDFYKGKRTDWKEWFDSYQAVCDVPAYDFVPELMRAFPEAKFVLTVRDSPEAWSKSYRDVVSPVKTYFYSFWTIWTPSLFWASRLTRHLEARQRRLYKVEDTS